MIFCRGVEGFGEQIEILRAKFPKFVILFRYQTNGLIFKRILYRSKFTKEK